MPALNFLSAVAMAEQIRGKELSPVELLEAHLAQIERLNPALNAFVEVNAEGARRQARAAEAAAMRREFAGPLHGVPTQHQEFDCRGRNALGVGHEAARGLRGSAGCPSGGSFTLSWGDHSRPHQHAGVVDGLGNRQCSLRADQQSLGSVAHSRRFERRGSGGDCFRMFGGRSGQ